MLKKSGKMVIVPNERMRKKNIAEPCTIFFGGPSMFTSATGNQGIIDLPSAYITRPVFFTFVCVGCISHLLDAQRRYFSSVTYSVVNSIILPYVYLRADELSILNVAFCG